MSRSSDDGFEMPRPDPFDDDAVDALLAGTPREDGAALSSFVEDLRATAAAVPTPNAALAAAIAAGGISTQQPRVAQWRNVRMKIKGFVAGLGIAGKLALGVGVAAAATTGAGAAGVLPGPVQHAVSQAVGTVTPFSLPDPEHSAGNGGDVASGTDDTTTTVGDVTTTTEVKPPHDGDGKGTTDGNGTGGATGDGSGGGVVTPTTVGEHHGDGTEPTPTTVAHDGSGTNDGTGAHDGNTDGNGTGNGNGTGGNGSGDTGGGTTTTPTTEHHDGDNNNPESLTIHCERSADPRQISCSWSASTSAEHAHYVLLRTGDGSGRVIVETADGLAATDTNVQVGTTYAYRVISLRADGSVEAHSGVSAIQCCGDLPTTTTVPTTEPHHEGDGTTTTTAPHTDGTAPK